MQVPKCTTEKCPRRNKDMYVYSDEILRIGICYACGMFDGRGSHDDVLEEMVSQPELILDLIQAGQLKAVN